MSSRPPGNDESNEPTSQVAEAERRFFARRSGGETLVISGQERRLSLPQRALETTITFGILLLVALSTANSIYIADWVEGMPDLRVTAAAGVLLAIALGRLSWLRWPFAMVIALSSAG